MNSEIYNLIEKIVNKKFKAIYKNQAGYDMEDVDLFLDQVCAQLKHYDEQLYYLKNEMGQLKNQLKHQQLMLSEKDLQINTLQQKVDNYSEAGYNVLSKKINHE